MPTTRTMLLAGLILTLGGCGENDRAADVDRGAAASPVAARAAPSADASAGPAPVASSGQNFTFATEGDLQIVGRENQYDIILPTDVLFDFDKAALRPEAAGLLAQVKAHFRTHEVDQLHVTGHTDAKGTPQYNYVLSMKRAGAVCDWLKREVPSIRGLRNCIGRGEDEPIAANQTPDGRDDPIGRQKNRRVTLSVVKYPDANAMMRRAQQQSKGALDALPDR